MQLHRWGSLAQVSTSNCPPSRAAIADPGDGRLAEPFRPVDGVDANYAPRRIVLDKILVYGAEATGVELRERFTVRVLLWDGERVVGVQGRTRRG